MRTYRLPVGSSGRFSLITDRIDTRRLEHESDRLLAMGLVVAILFQFVFFLAVPYHLPEMTVAPAIPVYLRISPPRLRQQFSIHQPQLVTRESLRKQYTPGQPRRFTGHRPDLSDLSYGELPVYDIGGTLDLAIGDVIAFVDSLGFMPPELPDVIAEYIRRKRDNEIHLQDMLLTIDDFDTSDGHYNGLVIYNPGDPLSITGIVELGHVFDYRSHYISSGIVGLSYSVKALTDIRTHIGKTVDYNRSTSEHMPFIYISTEDLFEYLHTDIVWFRDYLESGGFIVLENQYHVAEVTPAEASLKQFVREISGSRARFSPIPEDHALYHCYFHFDDGPPAEAKIINPFTEEEMQLPSPYIEGIYLDDRLVGIYSNKGWGRAWGNRSGTGPMHRIGINMLVYALRNAEKAERFTDPTLARGPNGRYAAEYMVFSRYGKE